jgi:hypothetical protein
MKEGLPGIAVARISTPLRRLWQRAPGAARRLSLADYVTGMEPTGGALAAVRVLELATLSVPATQ